MTAPDRSEVEELEKFMIPDHVPIPEMPKPPKYTRLFGWMKEPETPTEHIILNLYRFALAGVAGATINSLKGTNRAMQFVSPRMQYGKMIAHHSRYWKGPMAWFLAVGMSYTLASIAVEQYNKHDADETSLQQRFLIGAAAGVAASLVERRPHAVLTFATMAGLINMFPYATYSAYDLRERKRLVVNTDNQLHARPETETIFHAARLIHGGKKRTVDDLEKDLDFTNKPIYNLYVENRRGRSTPLETGPKFELE